jgi:hypothetical protein
MIEQDNAKRLLWMILKANDGFTLEKGDMEDYPGDNRAVITSFHDPETGAVQLLAVRSLAGGTKEL